MRLTFRDMTKEVNVFNLEKQPRDMDDQTFEVNLIENLTSEHSEEIEIETECKFELESKDFNLDQIIDSTVDWVSSRILPNSEPTNLIPPSNESSHFIELKAFPKISQVHLPRWTRDPSSHRRVTFDYRARKKPYVSS